MRRNVSLYIDGVRADLDDGNLILFNYTREDLDNPTVVKNSYSQEITLPGTPTNNRIFDHYYRPDHRIGNGFNAMVKTPFVIYQDTGEVLEAGYVKLNSVDRTGPEPAWHVTLYGGLGSFFYALSYDDEGNKRNLASLDYLGTGNPTAELNFLINGTNVAAAWSALATAHSGDVDSIWKVINFAPCYDGVPSGNFDAKKAILSLSASVTPYAPATVVDGSTTYSANNGKAVLNLGEAIDGWTAKDLRSYLQRPVLSLRALWNAIENPDNNGGYTVDLSALKDSTEDLDKLWVTLPLLPSMGGFRQEVSEVTLVRTSAWTQITAVGSYTFSSTLPAGTSSTADIHFKVRAQCSGAGTEQVALGISLPDCSVWFIQVIAYSSGGGIMASSNVKVAGGFTGMGTFAQWAAACGYVPIGNVTYEAANIGWLDEVTTGVYETDVELSFQIAGQNVDHYSVQITGYEYHSGVWSQAEDVDEKYMPPHLYTPDNRAFECAKLMIVAGDTADSLTTDAPTSAGVVRSNAAITKAFLLSTTDTPAAYLLSFAKMFGYSFIYDKAEKKVTVVKRDDLYEDETIDITRRVDLTKGVTIRPLVVEKRWFTLAPPAVEGAFFTEYKETQGFDYGAQRVNTNYPFNADEENIMADVVFRNAVSLIASGPYWNRIDGGAVPSIFIAKGNTYTLWATDGSSKDFAVSVPASSETVTYYNATYPGYDLASSRRPQFCDKEGKALDGANVLVSYEGTASYNSLSLTDDTPEMDSLNNGMPCWLISGHSTALTVPTFSRYRVASSTVTWSLDFGMPKVYDMPGIGYDPDSTIYARRWQAYLADRFDKDTKVMTCRVNFAGMQVGEGLLRKFYYYGGSLWALNKISNYSLTTFDPVDCEFVQVQDKDNYLNGQI